MAFLNVDLVLLFCRPSLSHGGCSDVQLTAAAASSPHGAPARPVAVSFAARTAEIRQLLSNQYNIDNLERKKKVSSSP